MEVVKTDKVPIPGGWYSQAFIVDNKVYTAGITPNDPATGEMVAPGNIAEQTKKVLMNLRALLNICGADLQHVFKTTCFINKVEDFSVFNEIYKEFFSKNPPARSTIQVGKFPEGMCIEIEAIAVIPK